MPYVFRLYVAGSTPTSRKAIFNLKNFCNENLGDSYQLDIIDVLENPDLAEGDRIIATPTLIKALPKPLRRLIGDFSNKEKISVVLNIKSAPDN